MNNCAFFYLKILIICCIISSCSKDDASPNERTSGFHPVPASLPASIDTLNATFYSNIAYDNSQLTKFDLVLPASDTALPLVLYIHGGGFTAGEKDQTYSDPMLCNLILELAAHKVSFATINYRLLLPNDNDGVLKCLNDSKRALQFIRYHAAELGVNPDNIVLMGSSAGAGTTLWIATHADMSEPTTNDPVLRENTRVRGAVCLETQATYDILKWPETVFAEYANEGMDEEYIIQLATADLLAAFYGLSSIEAFTSAEAVMYRNKVDMLQQISADDPEVFLSSTNQPYSFPNDLEHLNHHPLHAFAVMQRAQNNGMPVTAEIPAMQINTTNGENTLAFILRKLNGL